MVQGHLYLRQRPKDGQGKEHWSTTTPTCELSRRRLTGTVSGLALVSKLDISCRSSPIGAMTIGKDWPTILLPLNSFCTCSPV